MIDSQDLSHHQVARRRWMRAMHSVMSMVRAIRKFAPVGGDWVQTIRQYNDQQRLSGAIEASVVLREKGSTAENMSDEEEDEEDRDLFDDDGRAVNLTNGVRQVLRRSAFGNRTKTDVDMIRAAFPGISAVDSYQAWEICQHMRLKTIKCGTILAFKGDMGKQFLAVLSGTLHVYLAPGVSREFVQGDKTGRMRHTIPPALDLDGSLVAIVRHGACLGRSVRSVSEFERGCYIVAAEDTEVAIVPEDVMTDIIMKSRVMLNRDHQKRSMQRRRASLMRPLHDSGTALAKPKPKAKLKGLLSKAHTKAKTKKMRITQSLDFTSLTRVVFDEREKMRQIMAKPGERRTLDDLEFIVSFLNLLGIFEKFEEINKDSGVLLTPQAKRDLASSLKLGVWWKHEVVFEEGTPGSYFFFILSGSVNVRKAHGSTYSHLCMLKSGESFGELALQKGSDGRRSATIVTRELSEFLMLDRHSYHEKLSKYQETHLNERVAVCRSSPLFQKKPWSFRSLQSLVYPMEKRTLAMDKVVMSQSMRATHMFLIQRGIVEVYKAIEFLSPTHGKAEWRTIPVATLGKGDWLGVKAASGAIYADKARYNFTAVCVSPVELLALSRYDIFNRLEVDVSDYLRGISTKQDEDTLYRRMLLNRMRIRKVKRNPRLFGEKYNERVYRETLARQDRRLDMNVRAKLRHEAKIRSNRILLQQEEGSRSSGGVANGNDDDNEASRSLSRTGYSTSQPRLFMSSHSAFAKNVAETVTSTGKFALTSKHSKSVPALDGGDPKYDLFTLPKPTSSTAR
eukprot:g4606.t1